MILNPIIITDFRRIMTSSPIFYIEDEYKKNWNLICAIMDRVDNSVNNINNFDISNVTPESFVEFLTYCCIIYDCVKQLFLSIGENLNIKEETKYFETDYKRFIQQYDKTSQYQNCPDDKFFEFIRSITFAHPLNTNRYNFIKQNNKIRDKLFSPFIFTNNYFDERIKNPIGIAIYTAFDDKTIYFGLSIENIIAYVKHKYDMIKKAASWFIGQIKKYAEKWSKRKVNRNGSNIDILKDVKSILEERHCYTGDIDDSIETLECNVSNIENKIKVDQYKRELVKYIPLLCDWVDSLQNKKYYPRNFFNILEVHPQKLPQYTNYQLEKIFTYLDDSIIDFKTYIKHRDFYKKSCCDIDMCNFDWGIFQAEEFFKNVGCQHLNFNLSQISSIKELKLLVRTVLFLENQNQLKEVASKKNNKSKF